MPRRQGCNIAQLFEGDGMHEIFLNIGDGTGNLMQIAFSGDVCMYDLPAEKYQQIDQQTAHYGVISLRLLGALAKHAVK